MYDIARILQPGTLKEALEMLDSNPGLKIIAGGTDVLIHLRHGLLEGAELLSIRNIKGLNEITIQEDGTISIGAMATFSQITRDEIINSHLTFLRDAVVTVGGPQIRNMATIGGNICNGAVSADSASILFALNAVLRLESKKGERLVKIQDFYEGPGKVNLKEGEMLRSILISKNDYDHMKGCYIKYSTRKAMDIAMLGVSIVCRIKDGNFDDLRIALGVAAPTPVRCSEAEAYAAGRKVDDATIAEIGQLALKASRARDSWRASKTYREHLIQILTARAIKNAINNMEVGFNE